MRLRYDNCRTLVTLADPRRLRLKIRRCERDDCSRHHRPYRPEAEGAIALPEHEFGLDVISLLLLLCHFSFTTPRCCRRQHGHLGSALTSRTASCRRMVAIECGTCRSGRTGSPSRPETCG